jgi:NADH-quinone oxidoreductase subunit J
MNEILVFIILAGLVLSALASVMIRSLVKAAIWLALASAFLAVMMFLLGAWLAAVIELSVCAGMITVVFISAISLTKPLTGEEAVVEARQRMKHFIYLPFILIAAFLISFFLWRSKVINFDFMPVLKGVSGPNLASQGSVIWEKRSIDIFGQVIVLLSGVFGVVVLFKERYKK